MTCGTPQDQKGKPRRNAVMAAYVQLERLRQIRAHQVAAFVQAVCIALRAVAVEQFLPLHQNLSLCLMTPDCEFLKRKSPVRAGRG
jgi:hypothetical protein